MAKRPPVARSELEIARIVWQLGEASVRQVLDALPARRDLDFKTVQTYLRRLEAKGYLRSRSEGRAKIYTSRVRPDQVVREVIDDLVQRLFDGQSLPLFQHLIRDRGLSDAELRELRDAGPAGGPQVMTPLSDAIGRLAWTQLWQVTVVTIGVGLIVGLFCRRRPHLAHMMWMVVLVKCLTPPLWNSPTGAFGWVAPRQSPRNRSRKRRPAAPRRPALDPGRATDASFLSPTVHDAGPVPADVPARPDSAPGPSSPRPRLLTMLAVVWLTGAAAYGGFTVLAVALWRRKVRGGQVPVDEPLAALIVDLAGRLGVRRRVRLVVSREPIGPVTFGWIRPTVVVSQTLVAGRPADEVEPLLAHELVHVRRGDALVGLLQVVVQAVWWFHPLVWWANRQIVAECERCCDEEVIAGLACPPGRYARCLMSVLELKVQARWRGSMLGVRSFEVTKRRLEHVMRNFGRFRKRMPRGYWLVLVAGALLVVPGAGLGGARARHPSLDGGGVFNVVETRTTVLACPRGEGARVAKGDLVCELDHADLRDRVISQDTAVRAAQAACQNAKLEREVAELAVTEYTEGVYKQDLETARGGVSLAESDRKRQEDSVNWSKRMFSKGYISEGEYISEKLNLQHASFALEQSQTKLKVLERYTKEKTVKELESKVEKARADELAKQAIMEQEVAKRRSLAAQIDRCQVVAPEAGVVRYAPDVEKGAVVRDGQLLFRIVPDVGTAAEKPAAK